MGINISAYYITGTSEKDQHDSAYRITKPHLTWDWLRYSGDTDFMNAEEIEWEYLHDDPNTEDWSYVYQRPKDLNVAIKWVEENIGKESRFIPMLEEMKTDKTLYFHV